MLLLSLLVVDLPSDDGQVLCTLYDRESAWLSDPGWVQTTSVTPVGGEATCTFRVPPGTYAITFLHDANGNRDMDTNWLGLPQEAWGVSRDAPARLGPPAWTDAAFTHPVTAPLVAHAR